MNQKLSRNIRNQIYRIFCQNENKCKLFRSSNDKIYYYWKIL